MLDTQSIDELVVVRKIRETVRKWWGLELGFADARGYVLSHAEGVAVPPPNAFCKSALSHRDGFRRCNRSVEDGTMRLLETMDDGPQLVLPCHLGFPLAMAPITHEARLIGSVFTGGFLIEGQAPMVSEAVILGARQLRLQIDDPQAAAREIPVLTEREITFLGDLMGQAAGEIATLAAGRTDPRRFGDLIGTSPKMQRLYLMLDKVARSDATVLIIGENGTGKEVVARAIHDKGPRADRPFVATNCAALQDTLLESELFGHVKGAFTGAVRDKPGLFQVAHQGTLFLDEVGDTSPAMQVKLLRVLQEGTFMPVGATKPVQVDVRVVAAINRPLRKMVERGEFREDLYYRLNVIGLNVPPLRERKSDLPVLCRHFLGRMADKNGDRAAKKLSDEVMRFFWEFDWPGNVRQLENEIERLDVLSGDDPVIGPAHLSPAILKAGRRALSEGGGFDMPQDDPQPIPAGGTLEEAVRDLERRLIREGLVRTGWNKSQLARELGVSRTTLIKKVKEHGLGGGAE